MFPRWLSCSGRNVTSGVTLPLRSILLAAHSSPFRLVSQRSSQTRSKVPISKRSELRNLIALAEPEKYRLAGAVGLLFISTGVTMAVPYVVGTFIDIIHTSNADAAQVKETLVPLCKLLGVVFLVGAAANFGRVYFIQTSGQRLVRRLRSQAFAAIMSQETAFFDKNRTGELINRLSSDTNVVANSVTQNVSDGLRAAVTVTASTGMMIYTSPLLSLLGLAIVPFVGIMSLPFGRYLKKLSKRVQDDLAQSTQVAEERVSNIRTVRSFGRESYEVGRYNERIDRVLEASYSESIARASFFGLTGLIGNGLVIAVLGGGGLLVSSGSITVGQLSSFMLYVVFTGTSVNGLSSFYAELMKGLGSSTRLFELIHRQPEIPLICGSKPQVSSMAGDISLVNVKFSYPTRPDISIFKDLTLMVPAGQVTAVVGPSGSGKSTIASLLLRLYDIESGQINIDNTRIEELSPQWLREYIGIVSQEPVLFSASIRENIAYGVIDQSNMTDERVIAAAEQANAWQFISQFPEGLDTLVGERGVLLSGGQKQRVALARALLKDPRVLILDEATSALDSESEYLVQQALQRLMVGRTVIVIAHRLSTIRNAHNIVVLTDGQVVESGTYSQLINIDDGHFSNLVLKQLQHQTEMSASADNSLASQV